MGIAKLRISREYLLDALGIPSATWILATALDETTIELLVQNNDIPDIKEGENIPVANPVIHIEKTFDWGLKGEE